MGLFVVPLFRAVRGGWVKPSVWGYVGAVVLSTVRADRVSCDLGGCEDQDFRLIAVVWGFYKKVGEIKGVGVTYVSGVRIGLSL